MALLITSLMFTESMYSIEHSRTAITVRGELTGQGLATVFTLNIK